MKIALSLLLAEYVEAADVEHADTVGFQIVCPCCRESVFKTNRLGRGGRPSSFFSHRHMPPEKVADCEMRVASIGREAVGAFNGAARGQTLALFLSVLQRAVALDGPPYAGTTVEKAHWRVRGGIVGERLLAPMARDWTGEAFDGLVDSYDAFLLKTTGRRLDTAFARATQHRIARDVFLHLGTPQAGSSRDFLMRHAFLRVVGNARLYREAAAESALPSGPARMGHADPGALDRMMADAGRLRAAAAPAEEIRDAEGAADRWERPYAEVRAGLSEILGGFATGAAVAAALLDVRSTSRMNRTLREMGDGELDAMAYLGAAVRFEAVGTLLRLPYARMAWNHRAGLSPLQGLASVSDRDLGLRPAEGRHLGGEGAAA
jgi:hypothetical protein